MTRLIKILLALSLLPLSIAWGQNTTITATVVDSDGTVWANAPYSLTFRVNPSQPNRDVYNINGVKLDPTQLQYSGTLSSLGVLSANVYQTSAISPTGALWALTVCPLSSATACGTVYIGTAGSSEDVSSLINSAITAPRFPALAGAYGYTDLEAQITLPVGATYWNVTLQTQRYWNGSTWFSGNPLPGVSCTGSGTSQICTFPGTIVTGALNGTSASFSGTVAGVATISSSLPVVDVRSPSFAGGAVGNDVHDDTAAFNAAIASLPYGGTVQACGGTFKITSTIYLTNGVFLRGCSPGGEPWIQSGLGISVLDASGFTNKNSWVIDTAVFNGSTPLAYNDWTSTNPTYGFVSQVGVQGITIKTGSQTSSPIYGGIRMAFAPGALLRDITIQGDNLGIGIGLDYSLEANVHNVHSTSNYYGLIVANNTNAATVSGSVFDAVYSPSLLSIPAGVISSIFGSGFATALGYNTMDASHATSQKGVVFVGSENGGTFAFEGQNWPDFLFLWGTGTSTIYGLNFPYLYTEGNPSSPGNDAYVISSAYTSAVINSLFAYSPQYVIDAGNGSNLSVHANGISSLLGSFLKNVTSSNIAIYDYTGALPGTVPGGVNFYNGTAGANYLQAITTPSPITSTLAVGTPPLSVISTTMVPNLNSNLLAGYSWTNSPSIKFLTGNQTTLSQYYEGTWTPSFSGLTVVNGTGSAVYSGVYTIIGDTLTYDVTITISGTCTTASTAGTTNFSFPSGLSPARTNAGMTATAGNVSEGVGINATGAAYTPTWGALNSNVYIHGSYRLN